MHSRVAALGHFVGGLRRAVLATARALLLQNNPGPRALPARGRNGGSALRIVKVRGCPSAGPRTGCGTPSTELT